MKISCLMGTYGRYSLASEALSCFLDQDYQDKELIILNQHPTPLRFEHPQVKIINTNANDLTNLQEIRRKCLEYATGDYVIFWDDDDLAMPFLLSTYAKYVGDNVVWKPNKVLMSMFNTEYSFVSSNMEATHLIKKDFALSIPINKNDTDDHSLFSEISHLLKVQDMQDDEVSYVYRWANDSFHLSGLYGVKTIEERVALSRLHSTDTGNSQPMIKYDMYEKRWKQMIDYLENKFNPELHQSFKNKFTHLIKQNKATKDSLI